MIELNSKRQAIRQLSCDFFYNFSRFEYAIKASGYFRQNSQSSDAWPDWNRFEQSLPNVFQTVQNEKLRKACQYLLDNPPRKQVIVNNSIEWRESLKRQNESEVRFLLRMVRCMRNNLFHGGKHETKINIDTERTKLLLHSGLVILDEILRLSQDVKGKYDLAKL